MSRRITIKLLERMDEGAIDPRVVAEMCLHYMSEDEVADMCHSNDVFQDEEQEQEDE